jgi:hypothetical protein
LYRLISSCGGGEVIQFHRFGFVVIVDSKIRIIYLNSTTYDELFLIMNVIEDEVIGMNYGVFLLGLGYRFCLTDNTG